MSCLLLDVAMIVLPHHSIMLLYWFVKQMCNPLLLLAWPLNWDAVSDFSHFVNFHHTFGSRPPLFLQQPALSPKPQPSKTCQQPDVDKFKHAWWLTVKKKKLATSVSRCFLHQYFKMYLFFCVVLVEWHNKSNELWCPICQQMTCTSWFLSKSHLEIIHKTVISILVIWMRVNRAVHNLLPHWMKIIF